MSRNDRSTTNWRELVLTPLAVVLTHGGAVGGAILMVVRFNIDLSAAILFYFSVLILLSLIILKLIRFGLPRVRGAHSYETSPWIFYFWKLHRLICQTNLGLFYMTGFLPPFLRSVFYRLLGAEIGWGTIIGGRILDPYLVHIGSGVELGDDALIIPHSFSVGSSDLLVLDRVVIENKAVLGPRSTLMPGVFMGQSSMVKPMSVVPMNAKISHHEIWGGNPAQKVANVDQPYEEAA